MNKEEKRSQIAKVNAWDAAYKAMNKVAVDMAYEDMKNEFQLSPDQARMQAIGYMDSFMELISTRPEMPKVNFKLFEE